MLNQGGGVGPSSTGRGARSTNILEGHLFKSG